MDDSVSQLRGKKGKKKTYILEQEPSQTGKVSPLGSFQYVLTGRVVQPMILGESELGEHRLDSQGH
jgi:hypothetical protein